MRFICKTCRSVLTNDLEEAPNPKMITPLEQKPFMPPGQVWLYVPENAFTHWTGKHVIHPNDLLYFKESKNHRVWNGCCGPSGMDGPNLLCLNGHDIATLEADCWIPHAIVLEPDAVAMFA